MYETEKRDKWSRVTSRRSVLAGAFGLTASALLAACGGDDDDDDSSGDATESATEETEPEATESETEVVETETESATETETETATESETEVAEETESATEAPSETEPESGSTGFEFPDGRGGTISLPEVPKRVVAEVGSAAALWDMGFEVIGIFGPSVKEDGEPEVKAGRIDLDAVESIGTGFEDFDIEKLITLEPDLIVSTMWTAESVWMIDDEMLPNVEQIVPVIGVDIIARPVGELIEDFVSLAEKLGADLDSESHTAAKVRFEELSTRITAITDEKPGLTAAAVAAGEQLWLGDPDRGSDLMYFVELGLDVYNPEGDEFVFSELSWELAATIPADVILNDIRSSWFSIEELVAQPAMAEHPAVKADQVGNWHNEYIISYQGFGDVLEDLASLLEESSPDIV